MEGASDNAVAVMSALSLDETVKNVAEGVEEEAPLSSCKESPIKSGFCAICIEKIVLEEMALVKGCEHAYCVTCILRWAQYSVKQPCCCPQCKLPFESLLVHRTLDGRILDYMFEESVCLLLRAQWFVPLSVSSDNSQETLDDDLTHLLVEESYEEDYDDHIIDDNDDDDYYVAHRSSTLVMGNRRWGENGYVRSGRREARPTIAQDSPSSSSSAFKGKVGKGEASGVATGRRAKRAAKREAADKAAAAKHQLRLEKLGRV